MGDFDFIDYFILDFVLNLHFFLDLDLNLY